MLPQTVPIGDDDTSRDNQLTQDADTDNSILQQQCCIPNCFSAMQEQDLNCTADTIMRGDISPHTLQPFTLIIDMNFTTDKPETFNKYNFTSMHIGRDDGYTPYDMSEQGLQTECCLTNCYSKMKAESLTCPAGQATSGACQF